MTEPTLIERIREISASVAELQQEKETLSREKDSLQSDVDDLELRAEELQEELDATLERSDDSHIEANMLATFEQLSLDYGYPRLKQIIADVLARLEKYAV